MNVRQFGLLLLFAWIISGCDSNRESTTAQSADPPMSDEMAQGKEVWELNCRVCHGPGLAGAPPRGDREAWAPRIAKGLETLVSHATEGYSGPGGHQMPARGGNPELSDTELALAVTYMIATSQ